MDGGTARLPSTSPAHCPEFGTNGQGQSPWGSQAPGSATFLTTWGGMGHPSWGSVGVCDTDKHSALITPAPEEHELTGSGKQLQED